jgi:hypothetical protein
MKIGGRFVSFAHDLQSQTRVEGNVARIRGPEAKRQPIGIGEFRECANEGAADALVLISGIDRERAQIPTRGRHKAMHVLVDIVGDRREAPIGFRSEHFLRMYKTCLDVSLLRKLGRREFPPAPCSAWYAGRNKDLTDKTRMAKAVNE